VHEGDVDRGDADIGDHLDRQRRAKDRAGIRPGELEGEQAERDRRQPGAEQGQKLGEEEAAIGGIRQRRQHGTSGMRALPGQPAAAEKEGGIRMIGRLPALGRRLMARWAVRVPEPELAGRRHVALRDRRRDPSPAVPPRLAIPPVTTAPIVPPLAPILAAAVATTVFALILPGVRSCESRRDENQAQAGSEQLPACHGASPPRTLHETPGAGRSRAGHPASAPPAA
jgi:hypothetical protein